MIFKANKKYPFRMRSTAAKKKVEQANVQNHSVNVSSVQGKLILFKFE